MKTLALILLANAALWSAPAFAEEPAPAPTTVATASGETAGSAGRAGASGEHPELLCSKDDPYIEYRDCVNASTRDSNAKVRMAQVGAASPRG